MNRRIVVSIGAVVVIALVGLGVYFAFGRNSNSNDNGNSSSPSETANTTTSSGENNQVNGGNVLVAYYSAQGHTEEVANRIAQDLNADIFEITPVDDYSSDDLDWSDSNSRVSREHDDESLRNIELATAEAPNWDIYDTVLIGYPIWWGEAAWPASSFVASNDFTGKTVIPFCTSASSNIGQSGIELAEMAGTGDWQAGYRFPSNPTDEEIDSWANSLLQ